MLHVLYNVYGLTQGLMLSNLNHLKSEVHDESFMGPASSELTQNLLMFPNFEYKYFPANNNILAGLKSKNYLYLSYIYNKET